MGLLFHWLEKGNRFGSWFLYKWFRDNWKEGDKFDVRTQTRWEITLFLKNGSFKRIRGGWERGILLSWFVRVLKWLSRHPAVKALIKKRKVLDYYLAFVKIEVVYVISRFFWRFAASLTHWFSGNYINKYY